jgi:DNA-binding FrmR family transcriptional regulator
MIQRIHPSGVYPFPLSAGLVDPDTPGEYHGSVTETRPATPADTRTDTFRHSYSRDKAQLVRRLARIEGQVRGISRMIEREEYCVDILQQTAALRAAVDSLAVLVLEDHVTGCVRTAAEQGDAERYVDEVVDVFRRTLGRPVRSATRG